MMNKNELLEKCRYYKGENKCPFEADSPKYSYWNIEEYWVRRTIEDIKTETCGFDMTDYVRYNMLSFHNTDDVPLTLKSLLFTFYLNHSEMYVNGEFENIYNKYKGGRG